jgi:hypothetical protein
VTGPGGGRPVNLISSVCVNPKDPLSTGKMVNVMVPMTGSGMAGMTGRLAEYR